MTEGRLDLWCQGIFNDAGENLRKERDLQGVEMGKTEEDRLEVSRRLELDGDLSWLHGRVKSTAATESTEMIENADGFKAGDPSNDQVNGAHSGKEDT